MITAGPVWTPIDKVRVISNISTGATGSTIAIEAFKEGADVTLLLGPGCYYDKFLSRKKPRFRLIRFRFFNELACLIKDELSKGCYDVVIHSAAVADFKVKRVFSGKLDSKRKLLQIKLMPTVKLIDNIKRLDRNAYLVIFKLKARGSYTALIRDAFRLMCRADADLVVANLIDDIKEDTHLAFVVDRDMNYVKVRTKKELAKEILKRIRYG